MTKVTIDTDEDESGPPTEELPPVLPPPEPVDDSGTEAAALVEQELQETQEITATALDQIADDIGDLQEVVAALVAAMDSVVDYLDEIYQAEKEEGHEDIPEPVVPQAAQRRAKKELGDVEPKPRHRYRTMMLGRSGGVFK